MAKHMLMDDTGHTTIEFSKLDPVAFDAAMERFRHLTKDLNQRAGTRAKGETEFYLVKNFHETSDETLFFPALKGG